MITIYTDASCKIPLGISGWAAVIFHQDGRVEELSGSEKCGNINRMELFAAIRALSALEQQVEVTIYTDSQYIVRGSKQFKKPDSNTDLWEQFDALKAGRVVHLKWVQAHSKDPGNMRADKLAWEASRHLQKASGY